MSNVAKLLPKPTATEEVRESVVRLLETTLNEARAGEIDTVIIIAARLDGYWIDRCSETMKMSEAIGRIEITKQDWIAKSRVQEV